MEVFGELCLYFHELLAFRYYAVSFFSNESIVNKLLTILKRSDVLSITKFFVFRQGFQNFKTAVY